VKGRNPVLERRSAEGRFERFPETVRELVALNVDGIVSTLNQTTRAAATRTVPIVAVFLDPVEEGLIEALARPGGNITGLAVANGLENNTKRAQLLKEIHPKLSRVAPSPDHGRASARLGTNRQGFNARIGRNDPVRRLLARLCRRLRLIERERPDAVLVSGGGPNFAYRRLIAEFAAKNRLPAMYTDREFAVVAGLIAYGADLADLSVDAWQDTLIEF
jgi:putative tryptophan/tyrosine transport system substrate-binding protein